MQQNLININSLIIFSGFSSPALGDSNSALHKFKNRSFLLDPIQCQLSWDPSVLHAQELHCLPPFPKT